MSVKTEPLIPGLDLVDDDVIKEEDLMDTGAVYWVLHHGLRFYYVTNTE